MNIIHVIWSMQRGGADAMLIDIVEHQQLSNNVSIILNGFDEEYFLFYEEVDLCKRASIKSIPVLITNQIKFDSNQGTASSRNVSKIKHKSCIQSAQRYHNKYNGTCKTRTAFIVVKYFSWVVLKILKLFIFFGIKSKVNNKVVQYDAYYENI